MHQLYQNLAQLTTTSVTVFIDASLSQQLPQLTIALPEFKRSEFPPGKLFNTFIASHERQLAWPDLEAEHGIFTRFLLAGLTGEADENKDREVTVGQLLSYLSRGVQRAACRLHGQEQEPPVSGKTDLVLSSL